MQLILKTSGGFANLRIEGQIDTSELPPELSDRIERGLESDALREAAAAENSQMADGTVYELTILPVTEEDEQQHYVISDAAVEDEILEIFDEILHEIMRQRREAARRDAGRRDAGRRDATTEEAEEPPEATHDS